MYKGVAVWNYPGDNLENAKEFARRGFTAVSWLGADFCKMTQEQDEALVEFLRANKLVFSVHSRLPDPDSKEACDDFRKEIERCAAWQQKYSCLNGYTFDFWFDHNASMPYLGFALETLRGSGAFIACEDTPLNDRLVNDFLKLTKPQDDYGILMDLGHMNIRQHNMELFEYEDFVSSFKNLPLPVKEVHLHNNMGRKDEHMHINYGNLKLDACVAGLKKKGFDGIVTVEVVQRDWPREQGFIYAEQTRDAFFAEWNK